MYFYTIKFGGYAEKAYFCNIVSSIALTKMKKTLKIMALCALVMGSPVTMMAEELLDGPEVETTAIAMTVNGKYVRISNAEGEVLEIFNIAGMRIETVRIDSAEKSVQLKLSRGCYILKVGNLVRKISIQ